MKRFILIAALGVSLAACNDTSMEGTTQADAPAWMAIVGKTLVSGDTSVVLNADGTVSGTGIEGLWEERDGKYCRTLTMPENFAGTECQVVTVDGDQVSFDNESGRTSTWTMQ